LVDRLQAECFVAGCYKDDKGVGAHVLEQLLHTLHTRMEQPVKLRLLCCGEVNTSDSGQPRATGICYSVATGQISCLDASWTSTRAPRFVAMQSDSAGAVGELTPATLSNHIRDCEKPGSNVCCIM
jgi:Protein N-terminal asparagine amidohydrolase